MHRFPHWLLGGLLDITIAVFALWTVCCHGVVLAGGNGHQLWAVAMLVFGCAALGCGVWVWRRARRPAGAASAPESVAPSDGGAQWAARSLALAAVAGIFWAFRAQVSQELLWAAIAAFAVLSSVSVLRRPAGGLPSASSFGMAEGAGLLGLAVLGAWAAGAMVLPNTDDVLYVGLGVALVDQPAAPLCQTDFLHGEDALPAVFYRVHSFELLGGTLGQITGIPVLHVIHLGMCMFAGFLLPLAWARLFQVLDSRRWLPMTAAVVALFLLDGTNERSVAMQAFARLFQGKAVLASVCVPLIAAYAIELASAPTPVRFLRLLGAQICGIGLSSTGLWLAPVVAAGALCVPFEPTRRALKGLAAGAGTMVYPAACAVWVLGLMSEASRMRERAGLADEAGEQDALEAQPALEPQGAGVESARSAFDAGAVHDVHNVFYNSFGTPELVLFYAGCLLLAWPLARTPLARRYVLVFGLVGVLFLLNPIFVDFVKRTVTGRATYSRVLWFLPFPAAFALCATSLWPTVGGLRKRALPMLLSIGVVYAALTQLPERSVLAATKAETIPGLKVKRSAYEAALAVRETVQHPAIVVAPARVALALPMLEDHPYVLMTKPKFWSQSVQERRARFWTRRRLESYTPQLSRSNRSVLLYNLRIYHADMVVLRKKAARTPRLTSTLHRIGFRHVRDVAHYHLWLRDKKWGKPRKKKGRRR